MKLQLFHPEWSMNFRDSSKNLVLYLQKYSSPTNYFKRIRKTIRAFIFIFQNCTGSGLCAKTLHAWGLWLHFSLFQNMLGPLWPNLVPSGIKWPHKKTGKTEILRLFFFDFLVPFYWFYWHQVNNPWKCVQCYVIMYENLIQEFSLPYGQLVPLEVSRS